MNNKNHEPSCNLSLCNDVECTCAEEPKKECNYIYTDGVCNVKEPHTHLQDYNSTHSPKDWEKDIDHDLSLFLEDGSPSKILTYVKLLISSEKHKSYLGGREEVLDEVENKLTLALRYGSVDRLNIKLILTELRNK